MLLEKKLNDRFPEKDIIVYNCGMGGWTTAEILINFILKVYDYKPDLVIFYHAYNDIQAYLTPGI